MIIKIGDEKYKLKFRKVPCRWWSYEYHILLKAIDWGGWDKSLGYIGKLKKKKPFAVFTGNKEICANSFRELKNIVKEFVLKKYGEIK